MSAPDSLTHPQSDAHLEMLRAAGPPYPPRSASIGGIPNDTVDLGVSIMFIFIYAALAVTHMTIFQRNKKRDHFFVPSAVTFGFCMSRIATFSLRAAWSKHNDNTRLAIAASIFVSAGVVLLYVINLIYAQRILRAYHPKFGHSKMANNAFKAYFASIVAVLIMVIICSVLLFFTLDQNRIKICSRVQKFGIIYFAVSCFLPVPIVLLSRYIPGSLKKVKFGKLGTLTEKCLVVVAASGLLTFSTSFRAATVFKARPPSDPAWYHSKKAFYTVIPMIEVLVVILYAASRVDQRFYIESTKKSVKDVNESVLEEAASNTSATSMPMNQRISREEA